MCKKKCGVDVDMDKLKQEERKEVTGASKWRGLLTNMLLCRNVVGLI